MAIALVGSAVAAGNDAGGTSFALASFNAVAGNFIVVFVKHEGTSTTISATDTAGNTYNGLTQRDHTNGDVHVRILYAFNIAGHATNVITIATAASRPFRRAGAAQFSGVATTSPLDQEATGQANSGTSMSTANFGASVPSGALIFAGAGEYNFVTYTPGTDFTELFDLNQNTGGTIGGTGGEYRVVPSSGTYNAAMTQSTSAEWIMAAASFKEAGGGGGGPVLPIFHHHYRNTLKGRLPSHERHPVSRRPLIGWSRSRSGLIVPKASMKKAA